MAILLSAGAAAKRHFFPEATDEPAPSFQTRTVSGQPISLSDFIGRRKVALVFYRGSFSSTSTDWLRDLQESYSQIRELGAELIAVSTESQGTALRTSTELRLSYPVVSDLRLTKRYGTYHSGTFLTQPAVFLVDKSGRIRWKHIGRGPLDQPSVARILSELQKF